MTKTTETFSPYDSADYLIDVETAAAYLEAARALGLKLHFDSVA